MEGSIGASIKLSANGHTATLYLQPTYLSRGTVRARVTFEDIAATVPASLQNTLVNAVDKRLPST
ncbi:hypothetical protein [Leekyejoonella antrihumi]|uniref:Uncharacterized protein n=1 Tax=Leekyejoonella antrihumi TaxID=1660198 RepID=A0A563E0L4_9MICO|nr:hypothetical protein [Leekyejoonella antrihumi]TWP36056.1 hypothetical protein FGL98_11435 [Leekyejoonella antrihumi]